MREEEEEEEKEETEEEEEEEGGEEEEEEGGLTVERPLPDPHTPAGSSELITRRAVAAFRETPPSKMA